MRKLVMLLILGGVVAGLTGCVSYDPEHNRRVWKIVQKDFRIIRQDIDFYLGLDDESHLDRTEY